MNISEGEFGQYFIPTHKGIWINTEILQHRKRNRNENMADFEYDDRLF